MRSGADAAPARLSSAPPTGAQQSTGVHRGGRGRSRGDGGGGERSGRGGRGGYTNGLYPPSLPDGDDSGEALTGAVADGGGDDVEGTTEPHADGVGT